MKHRREEHKRDRKVRRYAAWGVARWRTCRWMRVSSEWSRQPEWARGERLLEKMTETRDTRCAAQPPSWQLELLSWISAAQSTRNDHSIRSWSCACDFIITNHWECQRASDVGKSSLMYQMYLEQYERLYFYFYMFYYYLILILHKLSRALDCLISFYSYILRNIHLNSSVFYTRWIIII